MRSTTLGVILLIATTWWSAMGLTSMAGEAPGKISGSSGSSSPGSGCTGPWERSSWCVPMGTSSGGSSRSRPPSWRLVFTGYALGALLEIDQPGHPMSAWFGLVGALLFPIALILILPAVALTFPTGTLPGPRWRWPVGLVAAMVIVGTGGHPDPTGSDGRRRPGQPPDAVAARSHAGWARDPGRTRRGRQPVARVRGRSGDRRDRGPVSAIPRRRTTAAEVVPGGHGTGRGPAPVESQRARCRLPDRRSPQRRDAAGRRHLRRDRDPALPPL